MMYHQLASPPTDQAIGKSKTSRLHFWAALVITLFFVALSIFLFFPTPINQATLFRFTQVAQAAKASSSVSGAGGPGMLVNGMAPVDNATVYLVESIPVGNFTLDLVPGESYTWEAQIRLVNNTKYSLDITAMYWNLVAANSSSGPNFTDAQYAAMGAGNGSELYAALQAAAARGVRIRILQGDLDPTSPESEALQAQYPNNVFIQTWHADDWFGGGIMHQKIWIFDKIHVYLGSANMDWLSLTQVKEMGVVVENSPTTAEDLTNYFDAWWLWTSPNFNVTYPYIKVVNAFSNRFQQNLTLPCWSSELLNAEDEKNYCKNPFSSLPLSPFNIYHPQMLYMQPFGGPSNVTNQSHAFISGSPLEVLEGYSEGMYECHWPKYGNVYALQSSFQGRTIDEDALMYTILDAQKSLSLSVMDFYAGSLYSDGHPAPVIWNALSDALIKVATSKKINVRMLVSYWAHTNSKIVPALRQMNSTFALCKPYCSGNLEIRLFIVPGWNETSGPNATYPAYSRVNHVKYLVSDRRMNVGTSNMEWSYFYQTAGASWNSDDVRLVSTLQQVFDRDWNSPYAFDLNFQPINP